jgi:hypothetical protein
MHRRLAAVTALLALVAAPLGAQQFIPRQTLISILETQKGFILKYIDIAPDSMLGFRPTPGVRTFAEQIEHAAGSDAFITHLIVAGGPQGMPSLGDSTVYRKNKVALRTYAANSMDHAIGMIRGLSDADMVAEVSLFGNKMQRHRAFMLLLDHFPWTLGATVPYLRLNGVVPPAYSPF